jgi:hypothetical protein
MKGEVAKGAQYEIDNIIRILYKRGIETNEAGYVVQHIGKHEIHNEGAVNQVKISVIHERVGDRRQVDNADADYNQQWTKQSKHYSISKLKRFHCEFKLIRALRQD